MAYLLLTFFCFSAFSGIDPFVGKWSGNSSSQGWFLIEKLETTEEIKGRCEKVKFQIKKTAESEISLTLNYTCGTVESHFNFEKIQVHGTTFFLGDDAIGIDRGKSIFIKFQQAEMDVHMKGTPVIKFLRTTDTSIFEFSIILKKDTE